jgi:hypothetical protein
MKENNELIKRPLPPYIPFKTLLNFIGKLKETSVPERIDRSVLREYSGSVQVALVTALKFMALISGDGMVSDELKALVEVYETPKWKEVFGQAVKDIYSPIIGSLNVSSATKAQLEEKFKNIGAEKDVLQKCVAFYVKAAHSAGIALSPHITKDNRGKRDPSKKRVPKAKKGIPDVDTTKGKEHDQPRIPGTVHFDIPLPGKPPVKITIPEKISKNEWDIVVQTLNGYISLLKGKTEENGSISSIEGKKVEEEKE